MPSTETIAGCFARDDSARTQILERARMCARLTDPAILPPLQQEPNSKLPQNFQSIGSRGIMTLAGKMLTALYPPDLPWFSLQASAAIRYDPTIPDEKKQAIDQALFIYEQIIQATLETSKIGGGPRRQRSNFQTAKRAAIESILITGESLERITDDYRIIVYRRDHYVTSRDSCGDVMCHIIKERVDPLGLSESVRQKAGLIEAKLLEQPVQDRMVDLYTRVQWQPLTKQWKIEQEIKQKIVLESTEEVSPFVSTCYKLSPPENYGRGFVELNIGDLTSLDALGEHMLAFAAICAKILWLLDQASEVRPEDLAKPTGSVVFGARIQGGQVQDVATLKADKLGDFNVVYQTITHLRKELGSAMLIESEVTPQKERTTATQVENIRQELQGALGGVYASISDENQQPTIDRVLWQMVRDKKLPPLPAGTVELRTLTGVAALANMAKAGELTNFMQAAALVAPEALSEINQNVLLRALARYRRVDEPGLILTPEQAQAKQAAAMQQQIALAAAGKAVDVGGNIVQNAATQPAQAA